MVGRRGGSQRGSIRSGSALHCPLLLLPSGLLEVRSPEAREARRGRASLGEGRVLSRRLPPPSLLAPAAPLSSLQQPCHPPWGSICRPLS